MAPADPHGTLPRLTRTPLMHCRHAVGNYVGLFEALFEIFYEIGELDGPLIVQPDGTLGAALAVDEQAVATKLAQQVPGGRESVLLGLVRTILLEDSDMEPDTADAMVKLMAQVLENEDLPTFEDKGDGLEFSLDGLAGTPLGPSQAQADEIVATFRSIGSLVTDLVGLEFPRLENWRIDIDDEPERWLELTGYYTVVLPSRVEDLLDVSFADDRLTLELRIDTVRLYGSATARFFRRDEDEEQERHELLLTLAENALGTFELHGITLALQLDDRLDDASREPFAPRHRLRLAEWARPALKVDVDSADIVIYRTWLSSLLGLLALGLGIDLEEFLEERVVAFINGQDDLAEIGETLRDYVGPVADRLIPRAHVAEIVRYRDPFVRLRSIDIDDVPGARAFTRPEPARWEPEVELRFEGLDTVTERSGVAVRNLAPDPIEIEGRPIGGPDHRPGNFDDLDPPAGEWAWPSARAGELIQLDLGDAAQRGHALAALASVPELTPRARAMAALSVHGLDPRRIAALRRDAVDRRAGTVLGRLVSKETLEWLEVAMRDGDRGAHVFRSAGYPADAALVGAELRHVQQAMVRQAELGRPPEPGGPLVRPFDAGIWTMDHEPRTPLPRHGGSPRDPAWYGLSTNCVVATTVYRSLRESGQLERTGSARGGARTLAWRVEDCTDVAADFSGRAPGGAPALAVAQIVVAIGPDLEHLTRWRADVRLRLKPRFHGSGCLPDASVRTVFAELACIEAMIRGEVPDVVRLRELEFRGFMVLGADLVDRARDIELVSLVDAAGNDPPSDDPVHTDLRDALADWLAGLPEVPVLYNPFRSIPGASDRSFFARGGWFCVERRYRFPDLAGLKFD